MGYQLRREVRDMLPPGVLTHKEARLVLELADSCNDITRRGWPGADWLAQVCDLGAPKKVGECLAAIARKWVELREEIGKDRHGRPVYTHPKRRTVYRFPTRNELTANGVQAATASLEAPEGVDAGTEMVPQNRGPSAPGSPPETGDQSSEWSPKTGDLSSPKTGDHSAGMVPQNRGPFSSKNFSSSFSSSAGASSTAPDGEDDDEDQKKPTNSTVAAIVAATGATADDAEAAYREIASSIPNIRSMSRLIGTMIENGDIRRYLPAQPGQAAAADLADQVAELRRGPRCPHGVPGGAAEHPRTREPLCPVCRMASRRAQAGAA